jgi:hypothetical protein
MARSPDEASREPIGALDIAALRNNVPPPDVRAATPAADIRDEKWSLPPISMESRKAVVELVQPHVSVSRDDTVIIAKGAWSAPRIYLERRPPAGDKDSGWYIGPTRVGGIVALSRVPVRDLLEVRPDFHELLGLPESYLVVLDDQGIHSLFTPVGDNLWAGKRPATG